LETVARTVTGTVGFCPHCGDVVALLSAWQADEVAACPCLCHAVDRALRPTYTFTGKKKKGKAAVLTDLGRSTPL
jgi:Rieske Fe-S protein